MAAMARTPTTIDGRIMGLQIMGLQIMGLQNKSGRRGIAAVLLGAVVVAVGLTIALLSPAQAQFWSPYGPPRRPPAPIQQPQQQYNPFGGFFGPQEVPRPAAPPDNSHAPSPQQRKAEMVASGFVRIVHACRGAARATATASKASAPA